MRAILFTADMMASSRIQAAAAAAGVELVIAATEAQVVSETSSQAARLILLDLGTPLPSIANLVNNLKQLPDPPARIVAFGPHVQRNLLQAAEEAGCDDVLARGEFLNTMARFFTG